MWRMAFLGACALATPMTAQQSEVAAKANIQVHEGDGQTRQYTGSDIRLCHVEPDASINMEVHLRDHRTKAILRNVRLCTPDEQPQVTLSATECVLSGISISISISQRCSWD